MDLITYPCQTIDRIAELNVVTHNVSLQSIPQHTNTPWHNLSIPKLQRCNRWSLGMNKLFHATYPDLVSTIASPRPYETEDIQYQHRTNSGRHWQVVSDVGEVSPDSVEVNHIGSCYHAPAIGGPLRTHCHPATERTQVCFVGVLATDMNHVRATKRLNKFYLKSTFPLSGLSTHSQKFVLLPEALWEQKSLPRLVWGVWNSLTRREIVSLLSLV